MEQMLEAAGARVDGWFYCPHHPDATVEAYRVACDCRKPKQGMIQQACASFAIDLARSFVIGDKKVDLDLGVGAGARSILVRTGHGWETASAYGGTVPGAARVAADLMEATSWVLGESGHPRQHG
jgi:D-glycero-D-manno-heptose 1,7-bisphosphate phosphatase